MEHEPPRVDPHRSNGSDPSALTTEQLLREVGSLKELMLAMFRSAEEVRNEKFESVREQFSLIERQRVEQKKDVKDAVDAALSAAKEAVKEQTTASERSILKSEAGTKEQLNQLTTTFNTAFAGVSSNHDDLKDRVGKIESVKLGGKEQLNSMYALGAFILTVMIIGTVLAANGVFSK